MRWKQLFSFRKPVIYHLDHLDLVIEDKMLLLLSWKFRHRYKISIPKLKKKYRSRKSAVVLKLPADIKKLEIIVSTFWRKRKFKVVLKKTKLTGEATQHLIRQFKPMKMPEVKVEEAKVNLNEASLNVPIPFLKKPDLKIHINKPEIINEQFIFPN